MREYIAKLDFYSGDIDDYIRKNERVKYDGTKLVLRGEERKAPGLRAAIGKFLIAATTDAAGKPIDAAPEKVEGPAERAARLKAERLAKVYGGTGNGVPFDETKNGQQTAHQSPRRDIALKEDAAKAAKARLAAEHAATVKLAKTAKLEVISETEGVEVSKVQRAGMATLEEEPRTFYESLLDGKKPKKLSVDRDSYVPSAKVVKLDSQDEAVEVAKLVGADGVTPAGNPLKDWGSMTATRKHAFIKKQKDADVLKKIINEETGETKRKAVERLNSLGA